MIDGTLEKLGITMDYRNLQLKIILPVLGWSAIIVLITSQEAQFLKQHNDYDIITSICIPFMFNYCSHINFSDLIFTSILGLVYSLHFTHNNYFDTFNYNIIHEFIKLSND